MKSSATATETLELRNSEDLHAALAKHPALLVYVFTTGCGICHRLWPKLCSYLRDTYPAMTLARLDAGARPQVAVSLNVHTAPTAIVFFEAREHHRFSHSFGINEVGTAIDRPYHLLFAPDPPGN